MARTALATQTVAQTGTVVTMSAANVDGHYLTAQSKPAILVVDNASGGSINVTIDVPGTDSATGLAFVEPVIAVAAGARKHIKITFGGAFAHSEDSNRVYVDFSAVTSVTVALITV